MPTPALHLARMTARKSRFQTTPFGPAKASARPAKAGTASAPSTDKTTDNVVPMGGAPTEKATQKA